MSDQQKKAFEEFVAGHPQLKQAFDTLAQTMAKLKQPPVVEPAETVPPVVEPVDTAEVQQQTPVEESNDSTQTAPTEQSETPAVDTSTSGEEQKPDTPVA